MSGLLGLSNLVHFPKYILNIQHKSCACFVEGRHGPQFKSAEFQRFANSWGFRHITSSPHFPQSNGEAERAVQTGKSLLRKSSNISQALLSYRTTPGQEVYSPAELLMGRKLRSTLPVHPMQLKPRWKYTKSHRKRRSKLKFQEAMYYNKRHRTQQRPQLARNCPVWIRAGTAVTQGTVLQPSGEPRSYLVQVEDKTLRRTTQHLQPTMPVLNGADTSTRAGQRTGHVDDDNRVRETVTRSGRVP